MFTVATCATLAFFALHVIPGQVILGGDTDPGDHFSQAVGVSGRWMILGAPNHNHGTNDQGSAYLLKDVQGIWVENTELVHPAPQADDFFGRSVAISGSEAIVGIPGAGTGEVRFYTRGTSMSPWPLIDVEGPANPTLASQFGYSVDIEGDWAAVGDPSAQDATGIVVGRVTLFKHVGGANPWQIERTFDGPTPVANVTGFGLSVSVSTNAMIAIGAPTETVTQFSQGRVYIYGWNGFFFGDVVSPMASFDGAFGWDVDLTWVAAISRSELVIGEPGGRFLGGSVTGLAHFIHSTLLIPGTWTALTLPPPAGTQGFGTSVAIRGATIVAGAPWEDNLQGTNAGAAYMFQLQSAFPPTWNLTDSLYAFDGGATNRRFGASIAIDESEAVVLVGTDSTNPVDLAPAYAFNY